MNHSKQGNHNRFFGLKFFSDSLLDLEASDGETSATLLKPVLIAAKIRPKWSTMTPPVIICQADAERHYIALLDNVFDPQRRYDQENLTGGAPKPEGLWFAVIGPDGVNGWIEICEEKGFAIGQYPYEVRLRPGARILWLRSAEDIDVFNLEFGKFARPRDWAAQAQRPLQAAVNWKASADQYDGIIADPYCAARAADHWYGEWGCASGCVWNLSAVDVIQLS